MDLNLTDYARAVEVLELYANANVGFVDASVFVVAERLKERKIASIDRRHFSVLRPRHVDYFTLLP